MRIRRPRRTSNTTPIPMQLLNDSEFFVDITLILVIKVSNVNLATPAYGKPNLGEEKKEDIEDVLTKTSNAASMFTGWMEANKNYRHARKLSYAEFPTQFVWKKTIPPKWVPRLKGFAVGKIHAVPASFDEACYLRILLNKVEGPECFEDIRIVDGVVCDSFRDSCYRRGLLDDDKEYIEAIEEASHTANVYYLRLSLSDEQLKNLALLEIEEFLVSNNSSLRRYSHMPFPYQESISTSLNPLMMEELSYDTDALTNDFKHLYISLTSEQKGLYNEIFNSWKRKKMVFFPFMVMAGQIVLNVASSGIASLLLEGSRTAHSRFLIPINLTEDSQCQVKGNTDISDLLKKTSLIIWDEDPMIHKHAFEVLDRKRCYESNLGGLNDGEATISIPDDLLIKHSLDPMSDLIDFVYPSMLERFNDLTCFQERALLAPLNEVVQEINDHMLAYFPGQEMEYLSSDIIDEVESVSEDFDPTLYSPNFLNGIKMSGMSNHRLLLKVGVPIMLLRNINRKKGLCNGTRLQVISLGKRVIEAKVVSGTSIRFCTLISRISLTPCDKKLPFKLKRRQFPISVCFAMTINKSQGQS
ncbi:uncharacterized protein LOC143533397 [Bidens hawaiensis]|uniref:uncharacterized protein LOC143533397 n=1 Tax=Bidens hawaiensis TaxID=980011 RepID=UPI00404B514E